MLSALLPELPETHAIRLHQAVPGLLSLTSGQIAKQLRALGLALNLDTAAVARQCTTQPFLAFAKPEALQRQAKALAQHADVPMLWIIPHIASAPLELLSMAPAQLVGRCEQLARLLGVSQHTATAALLQHPKLAGMGNAELAGRHASLLSLLQSTNGVTDPTARQQPGSKTGVPLGQLLRLMTADQAQVGGCFRWLSMLATSTGLSHAWARRLLLNTHPQLLSTLTPASLTRGLQDLQSMCQAAALDEIPSTQEATASGQGGQVTQADQQQQLCQRQQQLLAQLLQHTPQLLLQPPGSVPQVYQALCDQLARLQGPLNQNSLQPQPAVTLSGLAVLLEQQQQRQQQQQQQQRSASASPRLASRAGAGSSIGRSQSQPGGPRLPHHAATSGRPDLRTSDSTKPTAGTGQDDDDADDAAAADDADAADDDDDADDAADADADADDDAAYDADADAVEITAAAVQLRGPAARMLCGATELLLHLLSPLGTRRRRPGLTALRTVGGGSGGGNEVVRVGGAQAAGQGPVTGAAGQGPVTGAAGQGPVTGAAGRAAGAVVDAAPDKAPQLLRLRAPAARMQGAPWRTPASRLLAAGAAAHAGGQHAAAAAAAIAAAGGTGPPAAPGSRPASQPPLQQAPPQGGGAMTSYRLAATELSHRVVLLQEAVEVDGPLLLQLLRLQPALLLPSADAAAVASNLQTIAGAVQLPPSGVAATLIQHEAREAERSPNRSDPRTPTMTTDAACTFSTALRLPPAALSSAYAQVCTLLRQPPGSPGPPTPASPSPPAGSSGLAAAAGTSQTLLPIAPAGSAPASAGRKSPEAHGAAASAGVCAILRATPALLWDAPTRERARRMLGEVADAMQCADAAAADPVRTSAALSSQPAGLCRLVHPTLGLGVAQRLQQRRRQLQLRERRERQQLLLQQGHVGSKGWGRSASPAVTAGISSGGLGWAAAQGSGLTRAEAERSVVRLVLQQPALLGKDGAHGSSGSSSSSSSSSTNSTAAPALAASAASSPGSGVSHLQLALTAVAVALDLPVTAAVQLLVECGAGGVAACLDPGSWAVFSQWLALLGRGKLWRAELERSRQSDPRVGRRATHAFPSTVQNVP
ncbi:MAG: hypothetical protein WDW38_004863 [Sanguina aurantia]